MADQQDVRASFPDFPSKYWSTLTHHHHHDESQNPLTIDTDLEHLGKIKLDNGRHDSAFFSDFNYHKEMISPGTRTCSSLLSEMLRPNVGSRSTSPTTNHCEFVSERGSFSTHSTPPLQATPPKRSMISFAAPVPVSATDQLSNDTPTVAEQIQAKRPPVTVKATRHISFVGVPNLTIESETISKSMEQMDLSDQATPTANRSISFVASIPARDATHQSSPDLDVHADEAALISNPRPRAIRFAGSTTSNKSVNSSRRSSYSETNPVGTSGDESSRARSAQVSLTSSPVLAARAGPATCKSTLDAMLRKEAIAKVIETVPEEEEEDDEDDRDDPDAQDRDDNDDDEEDDDDDEDISNDEDDDINSILELDSDDDGYQEDVESDAGTINDEDIYPTLGAVPSATPSGFLPPLTVEIPNAKVILESVTTPIYRTAAPSESDLPDTTDFAVGTIDEDQPACIAFDTAVRDKAARRRGPKPSDIDPTFPDSGTDDESDNGDKTVLPEINTNGRPVCRSPPVQHKNRCQLWNSPPLVRKTDLCRARSLPRRYRKGLYEPKPQRAVTIKQSNEQRAQRRRDKKEVRQNLRRTKQEVDHNGHEKMKVHCLSRRKLIANANPCVIRPVMSI